MEDNNTVVYRDDTHEGEGNTAPLRDNEMRPTMTGCIPVKDSEILYDLYRKRPDIFNVMVRCAVKLIEKGSDYCDNDPSYRSNLMASEEIGIPAWKGVMIRMMDKWARLKTFARREYYEVKDESFVDTAIDNANYSMIIVTIYESLARNKDESKEEKRR